MFPPQVGTVIVVWNFKLTILLCEFKFFHSTVKLYFVHPKFSTPTTQKSKT